MILKIEIEHQGLGVYKIYINDGPVLNLAYFKERSSLVHYTFALYGKTVKLLMGNSLQ